MNATRSGLVSARLVARRGLGIVALALGIVGAAANVAPVTAEATPQSASPFSGSYVGSVPAWGSNWSIEISRHGVVSGAMRLRQIDWSGSAYWTRGRLDGTISDAGVLTASGAVTVDAHWVMPVYWGWTYSPTPKTTYEFQLDATGSLDERGDLLFTTSLGSFTWFKQQ